MSDKDFEVLRSIKSQMDGNSVVIKLSDDELKVIVGGKAKEEEANSSGTGSGAGSGCDGTVVHCHYILPAEDVHD